MRFSRRQILALAALSVTMPGRARAGGMDPMTLAEAYLYLLGRALVIRQEHIDLREAGIGYNVIKYNPLGSAEFVNPNLDVAYLEAWFAVDDQTPVVLEVPQIVGRYYTAQILDEWGEVIVNINERTFPSKPHGSFALVKPGYTGAIPVDSTRIELHSAKAKMLARIELKDDPQEAVRLQHLFKVTAMGKPQVMPAVPLPLFTNKDLIGVELFDHAEAILASALDICPLAAEMQQKVRAAMAAVAGTVPRAMADLVLKQKVIPTLLQYGRGSDDHPPNYWLGGPPAGGAVTGNFGRNYKYRTAINLMGIWANTPEEVRYFASFRDALGKPLDGGGSYVVHFPADRLPQSLVDSYWSVIVVSLPDYRVVANPQNRFNLNTYSPLVFEADGSLKIGFGPEPAAGVPAANWLPTALGKPFALTFRAYVPRAAMAAEGWVPPAVTALG